MHVIRTLYCWYYFIISNGISSLSLSSISIHFRTTCSHRWWIKKNRVSKRSPVIGNIIEYILKVTPLKAKRIPQLIWRQIWFFIFFLIFQFYILGVLPLPTFYSHCIQILCKRVWLVDSIGKKIDPFCVYESIIIHWYFKCDLHLFEIWMKKKTPEEQFQFHRERIRVNGRKRKGAK